jgi:hypothetical protein
MHSTKKIDNKFIFNNEIVLNIYFSKKRLFKLIVKFFVKNFVQIRQEKYK